MKTNVYLPFFITSTLSLGIFLSPCYSSPKKSSVENYVTTFEQITNQAMPLLESLVNDAADGFGDKTPARRRAEHLDFSNLEKAVYIEHFGEANSAQYYVTPTGKSWLARRKNLQNTLPKTLASRLQPIRIAAKKLRSLNPVPKSLAATDVTISHYADAMDAICDLVKSGIYSTQSGLDDADDGTQAMRNTRSSIENQFSIAQHKSTKRYIPG